MRNNVMKIVFICSFIVSVISFGCGGGGGGSSAPADRPPVLTSPGNQSIDENQVLTFTLTANDPDGNTINYSMAGTPTGATLVTDTGLFSWTPSYDGAGAYPVTFTATANSLSDSKTITITVTNVDRAPVLTSSGNKTIDEAQVLTFTLLASDPDGNPINYSMVGTPTGATLITNTGLFSWTPGDTQSGIYPVTFTATANSLSDSEAITITVSNTVFTNSGNGTWSNYRTITITNNSGGALTDYQVLLQPFRDSGDFIGDSITNTGIAGSWSFDEGAGITATDSSVSGNNGTLTNNPTWTSGRFGNGLSFDGIDDFVSITHSDILNPETSATYELWLYANSLAGQADIIQKGIDDGTLTESRFYIRTINPSRLECTCRNTSNNYVIIETLSNLGITTGQWYHVAFVVDDIFNTAYVFINGVQKASVVGVATAHVQNTKRLTIGGDSWDGYFNGLIDDVRIYNRAMSAREVAIQYQAGAKAIGAWSFDEGTGITATDLSGNNNNGTLTNGPTWTTGRFGNAVLFNASNDYLKTNAVSWGFDVNGTIEAWIQTSSDGAVASIAHDVVQDELLLAIVGGKIILYNHKSSANYTYRQGVINVSDGKWHHLVGVINGSKDNLKIFVDGIEETGTFGTVGSPTDISDATNRELWIGWRNNTVPIENFNGIIDDVRIYNSALSAEEVAIRYGSGLAGSWHFSEITGTVAADLSGNGNNGTLVNGVVITSTGRFGNALSFDGVDDYVSIPDSDYWNLTSSNGAIEMWVKADTLSGANAHSLISQVNNDQNWALYVYNDGSIAVGRAGVNEIVSSSGIIVPGTGQWYHIVTTKSSGTTTIYVNGTNVASNTTAVWTDTANVLRIGGHRHLDIDYYFNGLIDEVRIYNRALSASEIALRYNSNAPRYRHDFTDIRFTISNVSQEYSYWPETDTMFWVKIPSLPAGETAIRMYYGNVSATAVANGADTFVWFDDFNRADNDTVGAGYTEDNVQCNWNINNNMLRWTDSVPNGGFTGDSVLNIATEAISSHRIRFKRYFTRANAISDDHGAVGMLRGTNRLAAFWYEFHRWNFGANQYDLVTRYTGVPYNGGDQYGTTIAGSVATVADTWQNFEAVYYNQQVTVKIGDSVYSFADDLDVAFDKSLSLYSILIDGDGAGDLVVDIDDLTVRKYSAVEPAASAPGPEQ